MQAVDREEFEKRLALLCAGYNVPATAERIEGYWTGLKAMPLGTFIRAVETALGPDGPEKFPTTRDLWRMHKATNIAPPSRPRVEAKVESDPLERLAEGFFLVYVGRRGGVSPSCVEALQAAARKVVSAYRAIRAEMPVDDDEVRDTLRKRFDEVAVDLAPDELEAMRLAYRKTGRVPAAA